MPNVDITRLLNKAFAKMNTNNEHTLPFNPDHANICWIAGGSTEYTANIFSIESAAMKANAGIERESQECKLAGYVI